MSAPPTANNKILSTSAECSIELTQFPSIKRRLPILITAAENGSAAAACILLYYVQEYSLHGAILPNKLRIYLYREINRVLHTDGDKSLRLASGQVRDKHKSSDDNKRYSAFVHFYKLRSDGVDAATAKEKAAKIIGLSPETFHTYVFGRFRHLGKEASKYDSRLKSAKDSLDQACNANVAKDSIKSYYRSFSILFSDPLLICLTSGIHWDLGEDDAIDLDQAIELDKQDDIRDWPVAEKTLIIGSKTYSIFKPRLNPPPDPVAE